MKMNKYKVSKNIINPLKTYLNCERDKKLILKDNKYKSGIYRWVNKINNKTYIGSAVNLTKRLRDYFSQGFLLKERQKMNSIIYKALLKYGYSNFRLEILEYSEIKILIEREQYYLDSLDPEYNICKIAGSCIGRITKHSTRLKLKKARLIVLYKKKNITISFSEFVLNVFEIKVKKSESKLLRLKNEFNRIINKKRIKLSYEIRMKILYSTKTAIPVLVTDIINNTTILYPSASNAALALNSSPQTMMNKLKGKNNKIYKGRYIIKNKLK